MDTEDGGDAIDVEISDTQGHMRVEPDELSALARAVLLAEGRRSAAISIVLVDQSTIHAINRSHLGHDWPTDVISFPFSTPTDPTLAGELVVSAEMAADTAAEIHVDPRDELALYIVHGLLHLMGYDDLCEPDAAAMRRREDELLTAFGRLNPFDRAVKHRTPPGDRGEAPNVASISPPSSEQSESLPWSR